MRVLFYTKLFQPPPAAPPTPIRTPTGTYYGGSYLPDLVVADMRIDPPQAIPGQLLRVRITVRNEGRSTSRGGYLAVWLNQPNDLPIGVPGDAVQPIGPLGPGQARTFTYALPQGLRAPSAMGMYSFRAVADNFGAIQEGDETNNALTLDYQVTRLNGANVDTFYRLSAGPNSLRFFQVIVPPGTPYLEIMTRPAQNPAPGGGDCDVYVRRGSPPTPTRYQWASRNPGPMERISIGAPAPGTYFIAVHARQRYQNILLKVGTP